jgi:ribA/ribD-fused uncharacterized protein
MDEITADAEETDTEHFQRLGAFINLKRNGIDGRSAADIALSIKSENEPENVPLFVIKDSRSTIRLICANEDGRNRIVETGLKIFSQKINVEKPRPPTRIKVLYIYGIPVFEKEENIKHFLETRFKAEVKHDFRWTCYPGSDVRNGGRSISIEISTNVEIPGFMEYSSVAYPKPRQIAIWYPNLPVYCRTCFGKGHTSENCPKKVARQSENLSYASAIKYGKNAIKSTKNAESEAKNIDEEATMQTLTGEPTAIRPINEKSIQKRRKSFESNIHPFYSKDDEFSNHFECAFEVDGVQYNSTEQYLFSEKAKFKNKPETFEAIMRNKTARYAKSFGEQIQWSDTVESWRGFAKEKLVVANRAKFTQNPELQRLLLETAPKELVEASPTDTYWGVGLKKTNPKIHNKEQWKGENIMGQILMHIRHELFVNLTPATEETPSAWVTVTNKRQRSSPENDPHKRLMSSSSL